MYGDTTTPLIRSAVRPGNRGPGACREPSVVVGIIDEGIDFNHPDIAANVWTNPRERQLDGVDNDGNGLSTISTAGTSSRTTIPSTMAPSTIPTARHPRRGTVGGSGGNGQGVAGVNWKVKLISAKFIGPDTGDTFAPRSPQWNT